jgi:branched-chain amino acid transport system substrate-binding protein
LSERSSPKRQPLDFGGEFFALIFVSFFYVAPHGSLPDSFAEETTGAWPMHVRLSALAGAAVIAAALFGATAQAAAESVFKVGLIAPLSGPFAALGDSIDRGARLYEKVHGKEVPSIQVIRRDDAGVPDNTRRIAQELIVRDGIKLLTGIALSPQGFALAKIATEAKVPVALMNATTSSLTRSSPYFVRFSYTQWQTAYPMGVWAAKQGIKSAASLVADYAAGVDSEAAFKKGFEENGGKVTGAVRAPMVTTDYLPFMERIKAEKPEAVFIFVNNGRMPAVAKAFDDAGLREAGVKLLGPGDNALDDELQNMPQEVVGFIRAWKAEYGENALPNVTAVSGWDTMSAIYAAVAALGPEADGPALLKWLSNWKATSSPRGEVSIDPQTRDIVQPIKMNKVEMVNGKPANVTFEEQAPAKDPWKAFNPE